LKKNKKIKHLTRLSTISMLGTNKLTRTHMLRKPFKNLGLGLGVAFLLAGCTSTATIEESKIVIEKALTAEPGSIEASTNLDFTFNDTEFGGAFKISANEKSNLSDPENIQSETSMEVSADLNIPEGDSTGNIKVDAGMEIDVIGKDLYGSLTKLDITGDGQGVAEVNAMLPLIIGPYMNETVHLPLAKIEEIAMMADPAAAPAVDFTALEEYTNNGLSQDLADANVLVVATDNGVKKIKTASGKSVSTYHYEINLDETGLKEFMKKANEQFQLISTEELDALLSQEGENPSFAEMIDVLNEAFSVELWIGQEDYHLYKMELSSDLARLETAAEKIGDLSEADRDFFTGGEFEMNMMIESEPIDDFNVEKPADKDVIDLGPLLDLAIQSAGVGAAMGSPDAGATMTDEEFEAMMEGMDLGDLEGMEGLEDLQL